MTADESTIPEGGFIAWSLSGTADYAGAEMRISWGMTHNKHTEDCKSHVVRLPMPFHTATPNDLLREALYQFAEQL